MNINDIKIWAGKVSESYLKDGSNMNDAILKIAIDNKINEEVVKRICELANQNTYLSLFHADRDNRGNIVFDLALSEDILKKIKELDMHNNDYLKPPIDFRLTDEYGEPEEAIETEEKEVSFDDQVADFAKKLRLTDRLQLLVNAINTMNFQEKQKAEDSVMKISGYCKGLVFNGESFGDMAKLAMRYSKERGFDIHKTANIYSTVAEYLENKGFKVPMELTKTSSLKINESSDVYKPLEEYHLSMLKMAAFKEMKENMMKVSAYVKNMNKNHLESAVKC